jgi:Tfp pilus assembly protein PilF
MNKNYEQKKKYFNLRKIFFISIFFAYIFQSCASTPEKISNKAEIEIVKQFLGSGDYNKALLYVQPLVKKDPKNEEIIFLQGMAYLGTSNLEAAGESFSKASELNSKNYDAVLNLSYVLIATKKFKEARKKLNEILNAGEYLYPEKVHVNIGLSYLEQNQCKKASGHLQKSILLDPTMSIAHFNLGKCSLKQKNYSAAVGQFQKAVDFCPNCLEPTLELAKAQTLAGQKKTAVDSLERMLKTKLDKQSELKTKKTLEIIKTKF